MNVRILQVMGVVCLLFLTTFLLHADDVQAQTSALRGKVVVDGSSTSPLSICKRSTSKMAARARGAT
jgi:hypothetical protein